MPCLVLWHHPMFTTRTLTQQRPRSDRPRVVLDLAPRARWVAEQYPVESVEERPDGGVRVTLAAGEPAWLERLLLRLGPHARVLDGAEGVVARAAARVLARYADR